MLVIPEETPPAHPPRSEAPDTSRIGILLAPKRCDSMPHHCGHAPQNRHLQGPRTPTAQELQDCLPDLQTNGKSRLDASSIPEVREQAQAG